MRILLALLLSLICNYAMAQSCNSPSGFIQTYGTFGIGDGLVLGPDCNHVQDNGVVNPFAVSVKSFGAVGDGVADDTLAINLAINSCSPTSCYVIFPCPLCNFKISGPINIGNGSASAASTRQGIILRGVGNPNTQPGFNLTTTLGPKITWAGPTNNNVIEVLGPLQGWGVQNLYIDCASVSGVTGLFITSGQLGDSRDLTFTNCPNAGIASSTVPLGSFVNTDSIWNKFYGTSILVPQIAGAKGILLTGNSACNSDTDVNTFVNTNIFLPTVVAAQGIYVQMADTNEFVMTHIYGGNSSATSVVFDYTLCSSFPSTTTFHLIDPKITSGTSFSNSGTPGASAAPNIIFPLGEANGAACPNIANLACHGGHNFFLSPGANNPNTQVSATKGHLNISSAGTPTLTAGCNGAGSSVSGNDNSGIIGGQTAAATTCTLTFANAYSAQPVCTTSGLSGQITSMNTTTSTLIVSFGSQANFFWSYICFGT